MIQLNNAIISADMIDIITELKKQLAINGVDRFYKTVDTPNNLMVCCPYHKNGQEKKPSMGILKKDGTCNCFTCQWTGSLQEMISNCFGYDDLGLFGEKWLIRNFLSISVEEREEIEIDCTRNSTNSIKDNSRNHKYVSEEELDKYRYYHPYWKKRGITDERLIELFDLGYDKETDCITMPVRDKSGHTLFVARRSVKTKFFNYPKGVEKPLYGIYELKCKARELDNTYINKNGKTETASGELYMQEIIVCESMIDALTAWQYGKYAVALNGLGNNLQFKQLRELPCRKLVIATDNDEAGMKARQRIARNVKNKILTQYIIPEGKKDINELSKDEFLSLKEIFV